MIPNDDALRELESIWEEVNFLGEPDEPYNSDSWREVFDRALAHTLAAARAYALKAIGEDEDLNAPLDRAVDGNPESDTDPHLYLVRRATRNNLRAEQRAALTAPRKEQGSE